MKTVIDAVNEFKGEYEKSYDDDYDRCILLAKKNHREDGDRWHKGIIYFGGMTFNEDVFKLVCTREEFNQCVDEMSKAEWIKPVTLSPIYTQEMVDNGELPLVGMEVMSMGVNKIVRLPPDTNRRFLLESVVMGIYDLALIKGISAIKPPIELIDGKAYQFTHMNGGIFLGFYRESRSSFFYEKVNGNKICGKIEASNIQLLEVKS